MGFFFVYILKSTLCLAAFYLFYRLLLSKETFHRFNRIALLCIVFISVLIPFCQYTTENQAGIQQSVLTLEHLLLMADTTPRQQTTGEISGTDILLLLYLCGIVFFFIRSLFSIAKILLLIRNGQTRKLENNILLIIHTQAIAPFSWMKFIAIRAKDMEENGKEILIHEMAHIQKRHSVDLLIAEVCSLFHWFNPAVWLLKQEMQNIHEYEADESVINQGIDAKQYQLLLIKKAVGTRLYSMANSFNHSKLKKRITMMLKRKSNPWARLKYAYVLPLTAVAIVAFARPEVSQELEKISATKISKFTPVQEVLSEKKSVQVPDTIVSDDPEIVVKGHSSVKKDDIHVVGYGTLAKSVNKIDEKDAPLVIVDGKEVTAEIMSALNPEKIQTVSVLKDEASVKVYGEKGKNGVILVTLIPSGQKDMTVISKNDSVTIATLNKKISTSNKILYIVDGKELTVSNYNKQYSDPANIDNIVVLKDEEAVKKYGKKGEHGVLIITTKKNK